MAKRAFVYLILTTALFSAVSAQAQGKREREARKACLTGNYAKGISILSDLFLDTKEPNYIFNQGRCYEQNRRYEEAIASFQEYLRLAPDSAQSDKNAANKHIVDCQELLTKQTGQSAVTPPPVTTLPIGTPPKEPVTQPNPVEPTTVPIIQQPDRLNPVSTQNAGSGLRIAGIVTASVGGAALITGGILNLKANSLASDLKSPGGYSNSKESDRKNFRTFSWVSYSVGAACVATGAVLYYLGISARSNAVALLPMFAPDQAGAVLKGTY
jgi:tetratricopeptide (TPR) repeat protein